MIFPDDISLKVSRRGTPPYFNIHLAAFDTEYWPHQLLQFLWRARDWELVELNTDYATYRVNGYRIKLIRVKNPLYASPSYTQSLFRSYFDWMDEYRAPFPLKGKTVLDAGSGIGETALLFFKLGAAKVICVDINPLACQILRENADANGWNVEILREYFNIKHMALDWDFAKIDVEGGECCLLDLNELPRKPVVIEAHGAELITQLTGRLGLRVHKVLPKNQAILRNYIV